jgi:hypothetical protein
VLTNHDEVGIKPSICSRITTDAGPPLNGDGYGSDASRVLSCPSLRFYPSFTLTYFGGLLC